MISLSETSNDVIEQHILYLTPMSELSDDIRDENQYLVDTREGRPKIK